MSILGLGLPRPCHRTIFCTLLILCIVLTTPARAANIAAQNDPPLTSSPCVRCGHVDVSPGKFDLKLGADFPDFNSVKLVYPSSSILTNSTGDLLFTVTLTPPSSNRTINGVPNATLYNSVDIYVPPDFTGLSTSNVWTSFTNDYDPNSFSLSRVGSTDQIGPGWWRISVQHIILTGNFGFAAANNGVLTPNRIFVANQSQYVRFIQINSPLTAGRYFFKVFINGTSVGSANFPTLVVKGSRDAAYISGTLRDSGNLNSSMAGKPIALPQGYGARIIATGRDYLGRPASAQAFINSTAQGRYTIFGVAPGTYNITAYAAGFVPTIHSAHNNQPIRVSVSRGQSLIGIDLLLPHSVNVTGTVLSVDADGNPLPWGPLFGFGGISNRSIVIRLQSVNGSQTASTPAPYRPTLFTARDTTSFPFTILREVSYDGRIPQDFANYTSGLPSGDYYLRAYVTSYVQFDDVYLHVSNDTVRTYSIIRLIRSGFFTVTVHFKDNNSSLTESPLNTGGTLSVSAYDQQGILRGSNTTNVPAGSKQTTLEILGTSESRSFGVIGLLPPSSGLPPGTYHILARLTSSPIFTGFANIGVKDIYYQLDDVQGTIGLATPVNAPNHVSLSMFKGGGILLDLHSVDQENPTVARTWTFPGAVMKFKIIDPVGNVYQVNSTQPAGSTELRIFFAGLLPNDYIIIAETLGYSQRALTRIPIVLGGNSDAIVPMIQEPGIDLSLTFKTEALFAPIDTTQPFAQPLNHIDATPVRIEVYDDLGNFVAANATYIPNMTNGVPTTTARFLLAGFNYYFGDPKTTWAGFYDTTDASRQDEGGLVPGNYQILVWVDGYYQTEQIRVTLQSRQTPSLVFSMERASRISGVILGPDMYEEARPLSWATITLQPVNVSITTFSLDGNYQLWTQSGSYKIGVSLAGYSTQTANLSVPAGSDINLDFWLRDYGSTQTPSNAALIASGTCFVTKQNELISTPHFARFV